MPRFYLRASMDDIHGQRLAAVCYRELEVGGGFRDFSVLLSDEWGEKEVLRKLKDMGVFELGSTFMPVGPDLEKDLRFLVSRAIQCGILRLDNRSAEELIKAKLSGIPVMALPRATDSATKEDKSSGGETNQQIVNRLCSEGESFLRMQERLA